jgi:hypothetical protein
MTTYPLNKTADNLISRNLKNELCKLSSENVIKVKTRKNGITSGDVNAVTGMQICVRSLLRENLYTDGGLSLLVWILLESPNLLVMVVG